MPLNSRAARVRPFSIAVLSCLVAAAFAVAPALADAATLAGSSTLVSGVDNDAAGQAEAFKVSAASDGTVDTLNLFLDTSSKSTAVTLGLYASNAADTHPGALLAQAKITAPKANAWNAVTIPSTSVTSGKSYWLVALGTGGVIAFRDQCCQGTASETSSSSALTTLPATWSSGTTWPSYNASFYASGTAIAPPPPPPPPDASTVGSWGKLQNWPIVAVQSILMNTGKILNIDGWVAPSPSGIYDPNLGGLPDGGYTSIDNPLPLDIFCSGNVTLADGRVLLNGGHGFTNVIGLPDTTIYDPATETWSVGPKMNYARWYPTSTELGDGRIVTISGNITATTWADTPEIYDPSTNKWTAMTGINTSGVHEVEYPLTFLLPNGKLFTMATSVSKSYIMDPSTPSWTASANMTTKNGSAVMYRPGKILVTGGGTPLVSNNPSQKTAETIDFTGSGTPSFVPAAPMLQPRYAHTLTVLPDGKVLAVGGGHNMNQSDMANGELSAEEWDPDTNTWTAMASMDVPRLYHSTAILMPDGRVMVAGGGHAEGTSSPSQYNAQYYSPNYLFKGARPTITSLPSSAQYGSSITVNTPDAANIKSVALVSLGADTHTLDFNQHFVPLSFSKNTSSLSVTMPSSPSVAPPNTYMLFIVDNNGVPSIAPFVKVAASTTPPTVSLTAPPAGQVSGNVALAANASDTTGIASVQFNVDGSAVGPKLTSAPYTYNWDSTTVANGTHTITATAVNGVGLKATSAPVSVTTANVGLLSPTVDAQVSTEGLNAQTTAAFNTTGPADVLVAFATSDGPASGQTLTVSGAGLTWSLVKRVTAQYGSTEIWTAKAAGPLTGAKVTATQTKTGFNQSLTVVAFAGASGIGASATANAASGAPTVSLTTTKAGSLVYGAGNDYDHAVARTVGSGQTMVHQWLDTAIGDSYWVQRRTAALSTALSTATINDTAPTNDRWNLAVVEIVP